jgi:hypothetical protein
MIPMAARINVGIAIPSPIPANPNGIAIRCNALLVNRLYGLVGYVVTSFT